MHTPFASFQGHEQLVYGHDAAAGLRCIIAIHSTALGPALGGTRFYPYESETEALLDALRLSRAMTYKAACAGLDLGGGKAVIIGDPSVDRSEALLRAYGRVVESLGGRYITACDVGTYPADMEIIGRETRWVTGTDEALGGSGDSGAMTAYGVFVAMTTVAERLWGTQSFAGRHVVIQGVGKVGRRLAEHLAKAGAKLTVADVHENAVDEVTSRVRAEVCDPDQVVDVDADVLSPNALGGLLDEKSIEQLQVSAVCGGANNQLATPEDADRLRERGIVYAPDYVVNAGGLINVYDELLPGGYRPARASRRTETIAATLREVFALADDQQVSTEAAATAVAERRIAALGRLRGFLLPGR